VGKTASYSHEALLQQKHPHGRGEDVGSIVSPNKN